MLFRHLLPNALPPLIVVATVQVANAIALEATLSFLGLGLPPTEPSLGMLIANGFQYLLSGRYWISIYPGIALMLIIVAINLVGDQVRDLLNPRLQAMSGAVLRGHGSRDRISSTRAGVVKAVDGVSLRGSRRAKSSGSSASRAPARASPASRSSGSSIRPAGSSRGSVLLDGRDLVGLPKRGAAPGPRRAASRWCSRTR